MCELVEVEFVVWCKKIIPRCRTMADEGMRFIKNIGPVRMWKGAGITRGSEEGEPL